MIESIGRLKSAGQWCPLYGDDMEQSLILNDFSNFPGGEDGKVEEKEGKGNRVVED